MKTEIFEKLEKLPVSLQDEVEDFVDLLIFKDQQKQKAKLYIMTITTKTMIF